MKLMKDGSATITTCLITGKGHIGGQVKDTF